MSGRGSRRAPCLSAWGSMEKLLGSSDPVEESGLEELSWGVAELEKFFETF